MTALNTNTIMLAEGHAIDRAAVHEKRLVLDDLHIGAVLGMARAKAKVGKFVSSPDAGYFGSASASDAYHAVVARKDWATVDQLILDALARDRAIYDKFLDAEEWMQAFSGRLCAEAEAAHGAYRWMDPPELESYLGGTFESRVEDDLTRRGFKALSMNPALKFLLRKVMMEVPLDSGMRRNVRCIRYTALPRQVEARDERIEDAKNVVNVKEAEVRVPDGTPVPAGTTFTVQQNAPVDKRVIAALKEMYVVRH